MYFTKNHNWIKEDNGAFFIGITNYNVKSLGNIVYIDLPKVGQKLQLDECLFTIESVKTSSEIEPPFACEVLQINEKLSEKENLISFNKNAQSVETSWICKIKFLNDTLTLDSSEFKHEFLNSGDYEDYIKDM